MAIQHALDDTSFMNDDLLTISNALAEIKDIFSALASANCPSEQVKKLSRKGLRYCENAYKKTEQLMSNSRERASN